jgi:hypothetical protein
MVIRILIAAVVLFFFAIPLAFIAYAAPGGVLGGLAAVVSLGLLQSPIYPVLHSHRRRRSTRSQAQRRSA